jgi:hypothetical protein
MISERLSVAARVRLFGQNLPIGRCRGFLLRFKVAEPHPRGCCYHRQPGRFTQG